MLPFHHQSESILSHRPQLKISDSYQQLPYIDRALGKDDSVVLNSYIGEILEEIEVEEKRIIDEQRRAAIEVTARKPQQEG